MLARLFEVDFGLSFRMAQGFDPGHLCLKARGKNVLATFHCVCVVIFVYRSLPFHGRPTWISIETPVSARMCDADVFCVCVHSENHRPHASSVFSWTACQHPYPDQDFGFVVSVCVSHDAQAEISLPRRFRLVIAVSYYCGAGLGHAHLLHL